MSLASASGLPAAPAKRACDSVSLCYNIPSGLPNTGTEHTSNKAVPSTKSKVYSSGWGCFTMSKLRVRGAWMHLLQQGSEEGSQRKQSKGPFRDSWDAEVHHSSHTSCRWGQSFSVSCRSTEPNSWFAKSRSHPGMFWLLFHQFICNASSSERQMYASSHYNDGYRHRGVLPGSDCMRVCHVPAKDHLTSTITISSRYGSIE